MKRLLLTALLVSPLAHADVTKLVSRSDVPEVGVYSWTDPKTCLMYLVTTQSATGTTATQGVRITPRLDKDGKPLKDGYCIRPIEVHLGL